MKRVNLYMRREKMELSGTQKYGIPGEIERRRALVRERSPGSVGEVPLVWAVI